MKRFILGFTIGLLLGAVTTVWASPLINGLLRFRDGSAAGTSTNPIYIQSV